MPCEHTKMVAVKTQTGEGGWGGWTEIPFMGSKDNTPGHDTHIHV